MRLLAIAALCLAVSCSGTTVEYRSGPPGKDGAPGVNGTDGAPGTNGKDGLDGLNGKDGKDATPVRVVKFCGKSDDASFPEVGLCIGSDLYAVYSSGSAWLTEVVPGTYSTTVNGTNCTFTVTADTCAQQDK